MEEPSVRVAPSRRVTSIDALRGSDMFWIIGGEGGFRRLHAIFRHPTTAWISQQLTHVPWAGFHFYDLITSCGRLSILGESPLSFSRVFRNTPA